MEWYKAKKMRSIRKASLELLTISIPVFSVLGMVVAWIVWGY